MARTFQDPQEELAFLDEVETELDHLAATGVLDADQVERAHGHYATRRADLARALSGGGRIFSAEVITKRGTVSWIAWVGVAIVLIAALVFAEQTWSLLMRGGRLGVLSGFTAAFAIGAWYLYARTGMRKTGLAVLVLAEGMALVTAGYGYDMASLDWPDPAMWMLLFGAGAVLFGVTAWRLDEPWLYYFAAASAVGCAQAAIDLGFNAWNERIIADTFSEKDWRAYDTAHSWWMLAVHGTLGVLTLAASAWYARARDWRHANPVAFAGTLWVIGALVTISDTLLPGDFDSLPALAVALGLLWLGLAKQKKAIAVAATIGFAVTIFRVEVELFTSAALRTGSLLVLGVTIIALAVAFERRRKEILGKLGEWQ